MSCKIFRIGLLQYFPDTKQDKDGVVSVEGMNDVRRGVVLGCALDFPRPLGGLRSLGEGWWRSLGSVSAGEALGT